MEDNEIMTALRRCADRACYRCTEQGKKYCRETVAALAWDLMYNLKAENERLESNLKFVRGTVERMKKYDEERDIRFHAKLTETARAEAVKEFSERFENEFDKIEHFYFEEEHENFVSANKVLAFLDDLVKEIVGE